MNNTTTTMNENRFVRSKGMIVTAHAFLQRNIVHEDGHGDLPQTLQSSEIVASRWIPIRVLNRENGNRFVSFVDDWISHQVIAWYGMVLI
jgi:hypothetical protein